MSRARRAFWTASGVVAVTLLLLGHPESPAAARLALAGEDAPGDARAGQGERSPVSQPQPRLLAARYPGDAGIEKDPAVLFAEDFEEGALEDVVKRWSEASNKGGKVLSLTDDVSAASRGKRSLQSIATRGEDTGGHLYKRLPRGVDRLYARFYVKLDPANDGTHHFAGVGGHNPASNWPSPHAGERPKGDDRLYIQVEPTDLHRQVEPDGAWNIYAYWPEMKISADQRYWGQSLRPLEPIRTAKGKWQCVELGVQLNSEPGAHDGELALWVDGALAMRIVKGVRRGPWSGMGFEVLQEGGEPFEGFLWRTSLELQLNFFWLLHYVTDRTYRDAKTHRVWFDDIVVATEPIGPIAGGAPLAR